MEPLNIINNIINSIVYNIQTQVVPDSPVLIYMGIGTYAGLIDNNGFLAPKNYHQYPPFIQNLKNTIPNLYIFIILIDPNQENPPYMVLDKGLEHTPSPDIFTSISKRTSLYVWRESVKAGPHDFPSNAVDITANLIFLNNYAVMNNITFICHDFTGRRNSILADFFDKDIRSNIDHVIYGMGARNDSGCYIDLESVDTYMPFRVEVESNSRRPMIKFFNIYSYMFSGTVEKINHDKFNYPPYMREMIENQKKNAVDTIISDFRNNILTVLRQVHQLIYSPKKNDTDEKEVENVSTFFFSGISSRNIDQFIILYNSHMFTALYQKLKEYTGEQIDYAAKLREMDIDGCEILEFIMSDKDPYKWDKNISSFFSI